MYPELMKRLGLALVMVFSLNAYSNSGVVSLGHSGSSKVSKRFEHVREYCGLIMSRLKMKNKSTKKALGRLTTRLLHIERVNLNVTARHQRKMADLSAQKKKARESGDTRLLTKIDAQMRELVLLHLKRTKRFEDRKSKINDQIVKLSGDSIALKEYLRNREYSLATDRK